MQKTLLEYQESSLGTPIGVHGAGQPVAISAASNASPIVITSAAHGLTSPAALTGKYLYQVTFVDSSGETLPSPEVQVVLNGQQGYLTGIPLGPAGTTSRKIYRTDANGASGSEELVGTISDNTTLTYVDAIADAALGAAVPTSKTALVANPTTAPQASAAPTGLATKPTIVIFDNVGGNTNANGAWVISVIDANTFSLLGSSGNAAYTSGGTWRQIPAGTQFVELSAETQNVKWTDDSSAPSATNGQVLKTTDPPFVYTGDPHKLQFIQEAATAKLNVRCYEIL